jgi:phosphinothricin acetyltransferase
MNESVILRHAAEADLEACRAIYALEVREGTASFELEPPDLDEIRRRHAAVLEMGSVWLVAELDDGIGGYAYAGAYRPRPAYRHTVENSVYVARWARRRGLGRLMLERLVLETASRGFREMLAIIGDSANRASIDLHATCGFRPVGTLENVGFKFGRWLDTVLMQRALARLIHRSSATGRM